MKRIIGRRHLTADQYGDYGNYKVPCVDITRLFVGGLPVPHRQAWASSVIDEWLIAGKVTYKALDVGTNDGLLCAIIASKHLSPRDDSSDTIYVDGIEIHDSAYQASSELSKTMCEKGFKMHVHKVLFEDYETPIKYDVIFALEMLEHTIDPLFCIEKMYDLLEIGGHIFLTVPEEYGMFGVQDKNLFHYWTSTVQSLISVLFCDDRKWHIEQLHEDGGLIHMIVQKKSYMA